MDELLAVLGYKVKTSDMAQVAQKLEQLEEVMCNVQDDRISHIASETVHYNPSDLPTWVESTLSELNPPSTFDPFGATGTIATALDDSFLVPAKSSTLATLDFNNINRKHQKTSQQIFEEASCSNYNL
ncbi:hypothetical protein V6Z11_A06G194300 [Gossypium hirsutum]|uniref:DELLA protein GAIP-like n=1 Tax=Gossypium hirsutum TaxID=3635 RepID=A0A1U8PVK7_GOSHI|nr:DELLA protein GAIP-like [Gossypium hirsutum]